MKFQKSIKNVSRVFEESFKGISRVFKGKIEGGSRQSLVGSNGM